MARPSGDINRRNQPTWFNLRDTVAAAGTPEQLANHPIPDGMALLIIALPTNTNTVYIGTSSALALASAGLPLQAGDKVWLEVQNSNLVWVDAAVNGEGIAYAAEGAG